MKREYNITSIRAKNILRTKGVYLMHGIVDSDVSGKGVIKGDYNLQVWKHKFDTLFLAPTVSASTYDEKTRSDQIWGTIQVVYGGDSIIHNAFDCDADSYAKGFRERVTNRPWQDQSLQFRAKKAINRSLGFDGKYEGSHNELFVTGTPVAINVDTEKLSHRNGDHPQHEAMLLEQIRYATSKQLPMFVSKNGYLFNAEFIDPQIRMDFDISDVSHNSQFCINIHNNDCFASAAQLNFHTCFKINEKVPTSYFARKQSEISTIVQKEIAARLVEYGVFTKEFIPSEFFE